MELTYNGAVQDVRFRVGTSRLCEEVLAKRVEINSPSEPLHYNMLCMNADIVSCLSDMEAFTCS